MKTMQCCVVQAPGLLAGLLPGSIPPSLPPLLVGLLLLLLLLLLAGLATLCLVRRSRRPAKRETAAGETSPLNRSPPPPAGSVGSLVSIQP